MPKYPALSTSALNIRTNVDLLNALRPQGERYSTDQHFLKAAAQKAGYRYVEAPFTDVLNKIKLLDAAAQLQVVSALRRGESALVYRKSLPGEPAGLKPVEFIPIKLRSKVP